MLVGLMEYRCVVMCRQWGVQPRVSNSVKDMHKCRGSKTRKVMQMVE